jgi:hypothetical protein
MADVVLKDTSFSDAEMEGHISNPSGAILSLTFGNINIKLIIKCYIFYL